MKKTLIGLILILIPTFVFSASLKEAISEAARQFKNSGNIPQNSQIVISGIINYHSKTNDQLAKSIEVELYSGLGTQFENVRIIDKSEALSGFSSRAVFIKGEYKQVGQTATLFLRAVKGDVSGEIMDQVAVVFNTKARERSLVAVLDIESTKLDREKLKVISDLFREALNETNTFEMASSAEIDKMNPDDIQKATGCTRDTCATVIGEQLGVDRVISSSLRKLAQDYFIIAAKMIDVKDGSIVTTKSVDYNGNVSTLRPVLKNLTELLTSDMVKEPIIVFPSLDEKKKEEKKKEEIVYDPSTGLTWQKNNLREAPWQTAMDYCNSLWLDSFDDWRLPSKDELISAYKIKSKFPK